ncbi:hypothetical protein B484DRAFT_83836 [Ochromonadaceae sp. CCMP2298]|nr:hypothetical protein B484DRAFT_83836 [Ochromonadaceae sp. CCMP2298]
MQKLRREFMEARVLVNLILERELLREAEFRIQREVFDQQMHDALLDGTGTGTGGTGGNVKSGIAGAGAGVGVGVGLGVGVGVGAHVPSPQGVQAPSSSSGRRQEVPYRHSLQFPHLLYPPVAKSDKLGDKKLALKSGKDLKKNGKNPGAAPVGRPKLLPGAKAARKAAALAVAEASLEAAKCEVDGNGLKRRKNDDGKKRKRDRDGLGAVMNMEACRDEKTGVDEVRGGALEEVYTAQYRTIHADLDGPSEICQPPWPSFMEQADYREEAAVRSVGEYIDALEYRYDAENRPILPTKYRARCRVGRGGRLVVDRIPLYDDPVEREELDEYETPETQTQTVDAPAPVYIYPSSLSYRYPRNAYQTHYGPPGGPGTGAGPGRKPNPANAAANAAAAAAAGYGPALSPSQGTPLNSQLPGMPLSNARLVSQALRPHGNANTKHILNPAVRAMRIASIPKIPPFAPPARPAVHNSKLARLSAILSLGDAEEERVAIPRYLPGEGVSNASKSSAVELSRVKYVTRL